jgi:hypothetical protein
MAALDAFLLGPSAPSAALFLFLSSWAAIVCLSGCVWWVALSQLTDNLLEANFFTETTRSSPVSGLVQSHAAWPVRAAAVACHCSAVTWVATAKQDETLLALPSCTAICGLSPSKVAYKLHAAAL